MPGESERTLPCKTFIEITSDDAQAPDAHAVSEEATLIRDTLYRNGHEVVAMPTGERGGELFQIDPAQLQDLARFAFLHKDEIFAALKSTLAPILKYLIDIREKRRTLLERAGAITVEYREERHADGGHVEVLKIEAHDLSGAEKLDPFIEAVSARMARRLSETGQAPALPAGELHIIRHVPRRRQQGRRR